VRTVLRVIDWQSRICGAVAAAIVIVLVVLMVYDAVLRYAYSAPTLWAFDVSTYLMGASFTLAIGYTLLRDAHVRVDLLYDWIPRRFITWVDLIGFTFIILPTMIWLSAGLWEYFLEGYLSNERSGSSAWNPRVWPFSLVVFVGFAAATLQVIAEIVKRAALLLGRPIVPIATSNELPT
jgi:TRAP-type mannitol/chloroaromatic compound transport system permease small subunit